MTLDAAQSQAMQYETEYRFASTLVRWGLPQFPHLRRQPHHPILSRNGLTKILLLPAALLRVSVGSASSERTSWAKPPNIPDDLLTLIA
jgi:hypothetical protein